MKAHPVNLLIAIAVSGLLTYGIFSLDSNVLKGAIGVGSFIFLASTLSTAIGLSFANARVGVNAKLVATIFFFVALILNLLFAFNTFSQTSYIITSGVTFLLYVLVANSICGAKQ